MKTAWLDAEAAHSKLVLSRAAFVNYIPVEILDPIRNS